MSLPPSALYPHTGVAYNELETCYYEIPTTIPPVAVVAGPNSVLPIGVSTGTADTFLYVNYGRDVGLKVNRNVSATATNPYAGALVNSSSHPVSVSGAFLIWAGANVWSGATTINIRQQLAGQDRTTPAGAPVIATEVIGTTNAVIPFNVVLSPNDSLFIENLSATTNAGVAVQCFGLRASKLYGNKNTIQAGYIPA